MYVFYWTKWYGQNGMSKTLRIKSLLPLQLTTWFFHQSCFHFDAFSFPYYVLIIYLWLLVTKYYIEFNWIKMYTKYKTVPFVRTLLFIPFCPLPFCPVTMYMYGNVCLYVGLSILYTYNIIHILYVMHNICIYYIYMYNIIGMYV